MKILQVTTASMTLNAFLLPFAESFKKQGWQVDAAASDISKYDNVLNTHDRCFDIKFCRNPLKLKQLYQSLKHIRSLLKEQQYDVVHVHTPIAAFLTRLATLGIKNTKVFYTAHGFHYINTNPKWKNTLFYLAEKLAGYKTDHLFVINQDDYKFAVKKKILPENKITLIHGIGVDLTRYQIDEQARIEIRKQLQLSDSCFMLLQIAELNHNKNHTIVLQALALFKRMYSDADIRYVVVGEGALRENLQQQANVLGLSNIVKFLGQRDDIPSLLSACDALSLSSKREGLPRCILEAMCVKKPIVASKIRGCTDLLSSGAGVLVEYNNVEQWAKAIEQLYFHSKQRNDMGKIGYQLINDCYQQQKVVDAVLAVYKRIYNDKTSI
ncbi:glycosyltransferase family 4 protein [Photobacterium phosphoreum]|uniref:glycosyltransferase family 4 protein n=1 Tax=Photobacterium phosphoreum TaxID=659 RepID=UPI000D164B2C|nr:glycosyltransferase family 4 protein [Photobacterium phosphoreum]PTB32419.1 glycosyltransferase family 1 protein [Photobacterium phosphoreum]